MAAITSRTFLIYVIPAFVVVVGYYWFKKKSEARRQAKNNKLAREKHKRSGSVTNASDVVASSKQMDEKVECLVINDQPLSPVSETEYACKVIESNADAVEGEPVKQLCLGPPELGAVKEEDANDCLPSKRDTSPTEGDNTSLFDICNPSKIPVSGSGDFENLDKNDLEPVEMHDKPQSRELLVSTSPVTTETCAISDSEHSETSTDEMKVIHQVPSVCSNEISLVDSMLVNGSDLSATKDVWEINGTSTPVLDNNQDKDDVHAEDDCDGKCYNLSSISMSDVSHDKKSTEDILENLINATDEALKELNVKSDEDHPSCTSLISEKVSTEHVVQNEENGITNGDETSITNGDETNAQNDNPSEFGLHNTLETNPSENSDFQRCSIATDSDINTSAYGTANHSPSEEMLESPAASNFSDIHSEGSTDSGKSTSELLMPGLEMAPVAVVQDVKVYEFELPQDLCGRLIGRQGTTINSLKKQSHANIFVKRHPCNTHLKLCVVSGTSVDIEKALQLIRKKFPLNKYSAVSLAQVNSPGIPVPDTLQLHLPEGIMCDVILSSLINGGHFFLQQPTHPTHPSLCRLDQDMLNCYARIATPELPRPIDVGVICVAPMLEGWYRAQVAFIYDDADECDIKFVDYGGYSRIPISSLRQIRSDFMTIPFQASECYLANVVPIDEEAGWTMEAYATFEELAQGQILQAQVVAYAEDCIPYVHLFRIQGASSTFINRELVSRGVALWIEHDA